MQPERKFPKIGLDTQMLYERLIQAVPGEIIAYGELSAIIGQDVQTEAYPSLYTARKKARNRNNLAFGVLPGVGLKCLRDDEIVGAGYTMVNRLRTRAHSGLKTLACLQDYAGLPDAIKIKHNAVAAILMIARHITTPKKVSALEGFVQTTMEKLTFTQTIKFFEKK